MGVRGKLSAAVLALVLISAVPVGSARADDPAFFSFSAAWFDVNKQDDSALEGLECYVLTYLLRVHRDGRVTPSGDLLLCYRNGFRGPSNHGA